MVTGCSFSIGRFKASHLQLLAEAEAESESEVGGGLAGRGRFVGVATGMTDMLRLSSMGSVDERRSEGVT